MYVCDGGQSGAWQWMRSYLGKAPAVTGPSRWPRCGGATQRGNVAYRFGVVNGDGRKGDYHTVGAVKTTRNEE